MHSQVNRIRHQDYDKITTVCRVIDNKFPHYKKERKARLLSTTSIVCLATNIYFEARGEDRIGQYAVAEVTLNRVASPDYPDDVYGVVKQAYVDAHGNP